MRFDSLPLSRRTLQGLADAKFEVATEIQAAAIPHALAGRDILGAAKTGSGKTLSFVVPIIEKLYRERWSSGDGLAAIIITPTRELAFQIFDVIRTVGKKHQFSAGLVTGGRKEFAGEQERIVNMNILVATPGRLLQHFEQTLGFDASQLLMLVLDEADRILDMGFKHQLDGILSYLPSRQTLLFSATQTKSVKDLARLSLQNPEYLAVHERDEEATPKQLIQNYVVCKLQEKLDVLFSFIKTHLKSKMIVFFSTCAQVRFVYECFRGMQPGIPLTALHGKIKQERRTMIFMDFVAKKAACLFATDIASRGLDFPNVDWVIQADAPEDCAMYIHRVGRTARYTSGGRALMLLMPSEETSVIEELQQSSIPIKKLTVNPNKAFSVAAKAAAILASNPEYKGFAKKAFVGYLRSLQLLPNSVDVETLPVHEFAQSLGLAFTPALPIVEKGAKGREDVREQKNVNRSLDKLRKQVKKAKAAKRAEREKLKAAKKLAGGKVEIAPLVDEGEEDLLVVKTADSTWDSQPPTRDEMAKEVAVKKAKKMKINMDGEQKGLGANRKVLFDEDGELQHDGFRFQETKLDVSSDDYCKRIAQHAENIKSKIESNRLEDLRLEKERVREKRLKAKSSARNDSEKDNSAISYGAELGAAFDDGSLEVAESKLVSKRKQTDPGEESGVNVKKLRAQEELALSMLER